MKDYVFFPLAFLVAAAMVLGAMSVGHGQPPCGPMGGAKGPNDYSRVEISDGDLCRMKAAGGSQVELINVGSAQSFVRITIDQASLDEYVERGPHIPLGPDLETVFAGQGLRITISARPSARAGAEEMEINYDTGKAGGSGWQRIGLMPGWNTYQLTVNVPEKLLKEAVALDYLGLRPVPGDKARSVEVRSIVFERLMTPQG